MYEYQEEGNNTSFTECKNAGTLEKSCWGILIMNDSVFETFPNYVIVTVNFVTELFLFFPGSQAVSPKGSSVILSNSALCSWVCMVYCVAGEWIMSKVK